MTEPVPVLGPTEPIIVIYTDADGAAAVAFTGEHDTTT